jgi:hypothetical protein
MGKNWSLGAIFGVALVINPYLACSQSNEGGGDRDFKYSEQDMKLAVLGSWQGTAELDGVTTSFSLTLEQAGLESTTQGVAAPQLRPQCSSRSFVKPVGACTSESTMPLIGTISSENPELDGALDGDASAFLVLDRVYLSLRLETGVELVGTIRDQGVNEGSLGEANRRGAFSLSRP